jgi:type II secretory pathway pseudopilin PulG
MSNGTALPRWVWALLILVALIVVMGIAASLVLPGLLRARVSGNEASAIGTVRMFASAQAMAATVNGGFYHPDGLPRHPVLLRAGLQRATVAGPNPHERLLAALRARA